LLALSLVGLWEQKRNNNSKHFRINNNGNICGETVTFPSIIIMALIEAMGGLGVAAASGIKRRRDDDDDNPENYHYEEGIPKRHGLARPCLHRWIVRPGQEDRCLRCERRFTGIRELPTVEMCEALRCCSRFKLTAASGESPFWLFDSLDLDEMVEEFETEIMVFLPDFMYCPIAIPTIEDFRRAHPPSSPAFATRTGKRYLNDSVAGCRLERKNYDWEFFRRCLQGRAHERSLVLKLQIQAIIPAVLIKLIDAYLPGIPARFSNEPEYGFPLP
jgi:hypothetical protein